ncbi:MAG: DNA sulfur modification protein DndB [Chloroflexi bacterium]|nr:DNA sulfur modification protein DndB [Chloroflexota bacterium]
MKVQFPAMRACIGKRDYYATTMALAEIPRFFKFNDWSQFEPSQRAQRVLNESRVPEVTKYILDNEDGYIFSSITASFNTKPEFRAMDPEGQLGILEMDLETMEFIINDGQHRAAAIARALKENPEIGKERISVLLFPMEDLDRLQQMFSDLNRFVHKTSKSLDILYDHRDNLSALTKELEELVPVFQGVLEKERMSTGVRSPKLLSMSALYDANAELLGPKIGKPGSTDYKSKLTQAADFWNAVATAIPDWQRVKRGELSAPALRQEKINTHTVVLRAIGGLGSAIFEYRSADWQACLLGLKEVDWRKAVGSKVNPLWDNVCIVAGSVVSNRQARVATQGVLKDLLELPLSNQENQVINALRHAGWKGTRTPKVQPDQQSRPGDGKSTR